MKDKRFTLKFLGALMETTNITPKEFRKIIWHATAAVATLIMTAGIAANLPELIRFAASL